MRCKLCNTKKDMVYQCRNMPSIGFFEGWQCPNCKRRLSEFEIRRMTE